MRFRAAAAVRLPTEPAAGGRQPNFPLARSCGVVQLAVAPMTLYDDLHRAHRERVARLCRAILADPDEAGDAVQDVFTKLHRALGTETRPMDWAAWLTRVTVNACRDRRRSGWWRWWRERGVVLDDGRLPAHGRSPEEELVGRETAERVWRAVRSLPARQREVFALRQLDGLSTEEAAELLGISTGSVKQHLFRAVHALRRAVGDDA
jgi:RNA polymerase sigma-70 factor (ECF subfamily)